jgi:hypothetical protein
MTALDEANTRQVVSYISQFVEDILGVQQNLIRHWPVRPGEPASLEPISGATPYDKASQGSIFNSRYEFFSVLLLFYCFFDPWHGNILRKCLLSAHYTVYLSQQIPTVRSASLASKKCVASATYHGKAEQ